MFNSMQEIRNIFTEAKESASRHQKLHRKLQKIKENCQEEFFFQEFFRCIRILFHMDLKANKEKVNRAMSFAVKFCVKDLVPDDSDQMDAFLKRVVFEALKFHNVDYVTERCRCCQFVTMLLKEMGDGGIDSEAWDAIQNAMLDRLQDPKSVVRLQAVTALLRLQEPTNNECPVIQAFISSMYDRNAAVRKAVVENVGPNALTIARIVERLLDVDEHVRTAAFRKCALISPEYMKIANRQLVLKCGFAERNVIAKRTFTEQVIPRWLSIFENDIILFFKKLNLDADEEDLKETFNVYKSLIEVLCKSRTFEEITNNLPLNGGKLVPMEQLSFEVASYWNLLSGYLRKMEEGDDYFERIMPDLVDMCKYIERFAEERPSKKTEDYEVFIYEFILYLLFDMVEQYDFGDELSRKTVHKLITDILLKYTFHPKLLNKLMDILVQLHNKNCYELSQEICHLISEIREPLISLEPTEDETRDYECKLAQLKVRIIMLNSDREEAVKNSDYLNAFHLKKQMEQMKLELESLKAEQPGRKEKQTQDDTETTIRCLDILIALMQQPSINSMTPFLQTCKEMYLLPLISNANVEIFWRAMKLLVLYCMIDKDVMVENYKRIFGAIAFYRLTPLYEKSALFVTVEAVSDLIRIYGTEIFQGNEPNATNVDETVSTANGAKRRFGGRKLYNADDDSKFDMDNIEEITFRDVVDILVDLLDDECSEVGYKAGEALVNLLLDGYCSSATLISRLILKWNTLEYGTKLQQLIGMALLNYAKEVEGSEDVIEKAVIPTLTSIARAPKNSPLVDIDVDVVIRFLKTITNVKVKQNVVACTHNNIAQAILHKIIAHPEHIAISSLVKMLTQLQLVLTNDASWRELIQQAEKASEVVTEKFCQKCLEKFLISLKRQCNKNDEVTEPMETVTEENEVDMETEEITQQTESLKLNGNCGEKSKPETPLKEVQLKPPATTSSVKRRRRKSKKSIEPPPADTSDETILHTIIEQTLEQQVLEDVTIESVTSSSSSDKNLRRSRRNKTVVVETSTDSESSQKDTLRRTKRKKK